MDGMYPILHTAWKEKKYLGSGEKPPKGANVKTGPRGGRFYEVGDTFQGRPVHFTQRTSSPKFGRGQILHLGRAGQTAEQADQEGTRLTELILSGMRERRKAEGRSALGFGLGAVGSAIGASIGMARKRGPLGAALGAVPGVATMLSSIRQRRRGKKKLKEAREMERGMGHGMAIVPGRETRLPSFMSGR